MDLSIVSMLSRLLGMHRSTRYFIVFSWQHGTFSALGTVLDSEVLLARFSEMLWPEFLT